MGDGRDCPEMIPLRLGEHGRGRLGNRGITHYTPLRNEAWAAVFQIDSSRTPRLSLKGRRANRPALPSTPRR